MGLDISDNNNNNMNVSKVMILFTVNHGLMYYEKCEDIRHAVKAPKRDHLGNEQLIEILLEKYEPCLDLCALIKMMSVFSPDSRLR